MQMQTGGERARLGLGGQPALQAGLWRQDRESAGGGGATDQAQVTQRHLADNAERLVVEWRTSF